MVVLTKFSKPNRVSLEGSALLNKKQESFPRSQIDTLISQWLKQRQELLVNYSELCTAQVPNVENLQKFCQTLMDYVSTGHFQMFEKLTEYSQQTQSKPTIIHSELFNNIMLTTDDMALDFNEKYSEITSLQTLNRDLSPLGEALANRMDWEDEVIRFCLN